jgi:lipooligosaccharide transport system permease protein
LITVLFPILYLAAMGLGLGALVDRRHPALGGTDYLSFLAPGLLAAAAMLNGAGEALWPVLGAIKWERTYTSMLASPLRVRDVMLGHFSFMCLRIGFGATSFLFAMVLFGAVHSPLALLVVPAALLTGLAFAVPISGFAATRETDNAFPMVLRFVIIPSYLFAGTFFPLSQLPPTMQSIAKVTPLWHGVELCRALTLGRVDAASAAGHVVYLFAFVLVGLAIAQRTFDRRLRP